MTSLNPTDLTTAFARLQRAEITPTPTALAAEVARDRGVPACDLIAQCGAFLEAQGKVGAKFIDADTRAASGHARNTATGGLLALRVSGSEVPEGLLAVLSRGSPPWHEGVVQDFLNRFAGAHAAKPSDLVLLSAAAGLQVGAIYFHDDTKAVLREMITQACIDGLGTNLARTLYADARDQALGGRGRSPVEISAGVAPLLAHCPPEVNNPVVREIVERIGYLFAGRFDKLLPAADDLGMNTRFIELTDTPRTVAYRLLQEAAVSGVGEAFARVALGL